MAYRSRKPYVPITRSGSSILASLITQGIDDNRRRRYAEIDDKVSSGKLSPFLGVLIKHPMLLVWAFLDLVALVRLLTM